MIAPPRAAEAAQATEPGAGFATRFDDLPPRQRFPEAGESIDLPFDVTDGISRMALAYRIKAPTAILAFRGLAGGDPVRLGVRFRIGREADERPRLVVVQVMGGPARLELIEPVRKGRARSDQRNVLEVTTPLDGVPANGLLIIELGDPPPALPAWLQGRLAPDGLYAVEVTGVRMRSAAAAPASVRRSTAGLVALTPGDLAGAVDAPSRRVRLEAALVMPRWRSRRRSERPVLGAARAAGASGARGGTLRPSKATRRLIRRTAGMWQRTRGLAARGLRETIRLLRSGGGRAARLAVRLVPRAVKRSVAGAVVRWLAARGRLRGMAVTVSTGVEHTLDVRYEGRRTVVVDLPSALTEPLVLRLTPVDRSPTGLLGRWLGWTVLPAE